MHFEKEQSKCETISDFWCGAQCTPHEPNPGLMADRNSLLGQCFQTVEFGDLLLDNKIDVLS